MKFKNINTGKILTESEYDMLLEREYKQLWENDLCEFAEEFKSEGKTFKDYLKHMLETNVDTDFMVIEE